MESKEDRNGMTVQSVIQKTCASLLQEVLRQYILEKDMNKVLNDPANKRFMERLLNKEQKEMVYTRTGVFNGSYVDFDVSLLYCLIRNLTRIRDHKTGWGNEPDITDNSIAANIERIRLLRNKYAHCSKSLSDTTFEEVGKEIISCIHGIERTLPGQSTKFEDGASNLLKCKGNLCFVLEPIVLVFKHLCEWTFVY